MLPSGLGGDKVHWCFAEADESDEFDMERIDALLQADVDWVRSALTQT